MNCYFIYHGVPDRPRFRITARCADQVAFPYPGEVIEIGTGAQVFAGRRQMDSRNDTSSRFG